MDSPLILFIFFLNKLIILLLVYQKIAFRAIKVLTVLLRVLNLSSKSVAPRAGFEPAT
jgi:hypothetical protein